MKINEIKMFLIYNLDIKFCFEFRASNFEFKHL